jgi:hypothetical protein
MMFCPPNEVNAVWSVVARATADNDLGIAAKVAPEGGDSRDRLICIYTKDFNDMEDVTRVVRKMKDLGLIDTRERSIYYKCGQYDIAYNLNIADMGYRRIYILGTEQGQPVQHQSFIVCLS